MPLGFSKSPLQVDMTPREEPYQRKAVVKISRSISVLVCYPSVQLKKPLYICNHVLVEITFCPLQVTLYHMETSNLFSFDSFPKFA